MREIAIVGPTASGKSALAIEIAERSGASILSLDSLAIYREIDIVSAKPSKEELRRVPHFGVDLIDPDGYFSVQQYIELYREVSQRVEREGKPLIIVGGTLFYLKALLTGLSPMPHFSPQCRERVEGILESLEGAYRLLQEIDPPFAARITRSDRYRIEKGLLIHCATGLPPTLYFQSHPPRPVVGELPIFAIQYSPQELRERLKVRTRKMVEAGLIDEIFSLEKRYGRGIRPMGAIGVVETLDYLDGKYTLKELQERIVTNSARLGKRQRTFIRTQLEGVIPIEPGDYRRPLALLRGGS
ncbi:MAG: tRNA (adenosine(37)-N6)-dimethylallyltransferase MiaA [Epsilonproteobacteria bacterium]|nr:tRNA (adenosine(37)-N6)-dimethylallyltransferase MiaA [Campylobacterota bacterium]NPA57181.1 tRNA (adenosine(37)-N6)-dimethylallyltransferase MiaA [Campylobacterota bacterium]